MRSEGYGSRVCVCVCVCVSHLTSGASVRPENAVTHSAGNEGQNFVSFSETAPLQRSSAPPLAGHTYGRPFFLRITRMRIVHTQFRDVTLELHAVSSPYALYSFTMIILGLERVVYLVVS